MNVPLEEQEPYQEAEPYANHKPMQDVYHTARRQHSASPQWEFCHFFFNLRTVHLCRTSSFFRGRWGGVKNRPNLPTDSSKKNFRREGVRAQKS